MVRITDRDRELLGFVAEHRLILAAHAQALLGVSAGGAYARLHSLTRAGMLNHRTLFHNQPGCYQATRKGLALIGSELPPPRLDLRCYGHDVGVAWLWLTAHNGTWGPFREVLSERRLRSWDASPEGRADPQAVRLGGLGPGGQPRLHYPDLLLVDERGRRIALELELSAKGRTRREKILAGYGADRRLDGVVYFTHKLAIAHSVQATAASLGISDRVHVQWVRGGPAVGASSAAIAGRAAPSRSRASATPGRGLPAANSPSAARAQAAGGR